MLGHWQEAFLGVLRRKGNVSLAAQLAGVDRTTVYYHYRTNREFKLAWDRALKLYSETRRQRAVIRPA